MIIFSPLQVIWTKLSSLGVDESFTMEERKRIMVSNQLAIFVWLITFNWIFVFLFLGVPTSFYLLILGPLLSVFVVFLLNHLKKNKASRILLLLTGNLLIFSISLVLGLDYGHHLFLIPAAVTPFTFFSLHNVRYIIGGLLLPVFLTVILLIVDYYGIRFHDMPPVMVKVYFYTTFYSSIVMVVGFVYLVWIADVRAETALQTTLEHIRQDLKMAQNIQNNILPNAYNQIQNLNFHTVYKPMSEVGGDFYDIEEIEPGYIRVFLADATGHGIQAALLTMVIKGEYENLKRTIETPDLLFNKLNQTFIDKFYSLNSYFTCFIVDIDLQNRRLLYASAGHPDQFLLKNDSLTRLSHTGSLIGLLPETVFKLGQEQYEDGDKLLLFSDGIMEQFNMEQEEFGEERFLKAIRDNQTSATNVIIDSSLAALNKFLHNKEKQDDITLIGIDTHR